ncbi:MAG: Ppx/GppA family phosphatase [Alphaproteobacteria bacterium]
MNNPLSRSEFLAGAGLSSTDRIAVVDIGSNSVRLVVYNRGARALIPLFNEKIFCGIGRKIQSTGKLDVDGMQKAIDALSRYRQLISSTRAVQVEAVATAAVRDASNGREFVAHAENVLNAPIRILSGEEEGRLSAIGVHAGIPEASGIVGDLGGGSLELVKIGRNKVGDAVTLPLGPLRLMDLGLDSLKATRAYVDEQLSKVGWLKSGRGQTFYLVGGSWRNLARLHLDQNEYPLTILHQYGVDGEEAAEFCRSVAKLGRKSLEGIAGIAKKRLEGLPLAALVLERLVEATSCKEVMVSAYGLREGIVAEAQGAAFLSIDPVFAVAQDLCAQMARDPALCAELVDWTAPLFKWETPEQRRLRIAACWLSDIAWRKHPEYRSEVGFTHVLSEQFSGLDHFGRAFLALTLHERYPEGRDNDEIKAVRNFLPEDARDRARILGLALRLGIALAGACAGTLPHCPLSIEGDRVRLQVPRHMGSLTGETINKRLADVAEALERSHRITLI